MRILVLGATGMLGSALMAEGRARGLDMLGAARRDAPVPLDLLDDGQAASALERLAPELVINAAALTDLAACEKDPGAAYRINARAAGIVGQAAASRGVRFIQVSTDHFFTGDRDQRHGEDAPVRLLNEYARSKYAGERFALLDPGALVIRTNIVGFRRPSLQPSLVDWLLGALEKGSEITAFDDFFTSSIHVRQLARAVFDLLPKRPCGVLNVASSEVASKKAFIEALIARLGGAPVPVKSGSVRSLTGSPRAESLGLDVRKAEGLLGYALPTLAEVADSIVQERRGIPA